MARPPLSAMSLHTAQGRRKYLTPGERSRFLAAAFAEPPKIGTLCLTLAFTGCRISEALALIRVGPPLESEETALGLAIRRYVEANLATVDVANLAARFGLSRAVLYRRFPGPGGIAAYIRDRRLAEAMRRLRTTEGERPRLARLSHACGFVDPRVFSRAFHRKYGVWPGQVCRASLDAGPATSPSQPMAWLSEL